MVILQTECGLFTLKLLIAERAITMIAPWKMNTTDGRVGTLWRVYQGYLPILYPCLLDNPRTGAKLFLRWFLMESRASENQQWHAKPVFLLKCDWPIHLNTCAYVRMYIYANIWIRKRLSEFPVHRANFQYPLALLLEVFQSSSFL